MIDKRNFQPALNYRWLWIFLVSAVFLVVFSKIESAHRAASPFGPLPDWMISFRIDADHYRQDFTSRQVGELFVKIETVLADDGEFGDSFGSSVAISGNTAVVGAPGDDDLGNLVGAAYVFEWDPNGETWNQVKKIYPSDTVLNGRFGGTVRIDGDIIAIGGYGIAYQTPVAAGYVYERNQGGAENWGEIKKVTPSSTTAPFSFGLDFDLDGDLLVVSSHVDNISPGFYGSVFIFKRDNGGSSNWGEVIKLIAPEPNNFMFGHGVAIHGDFTAIGAANPGAIYLFEQNAGGADNWGFVKKIEGSEVEPDEFFASQVSLSQDALAAISGFGNKVYVFLRDQGGPDNWGEVKKIAGDDHQVWFGYPGMSFIDQNRLFIYGFPFSSEDPGVVLIFQEDAGGANNWGVEQAITPHFISTGFDNFGSSLSSDGDRLLIGQPSYDLEGADNVGAANYYIQVTATPTATPTPTATMTPLTPTATATATSTATQATATPTTTPMEENFVYLPIILKEP